MKQMATKMRTLLCLLAVLVLTGLALPARADAPAQPKLIGTISSSSTSLEVLWDAVDGAVSYNVYKVDPDTNLWVAVASNVKDTRCTDQGLKPGQEYVYTVRAWGGEYTTNSSGKKVKLLSSYENTIKGATVSAAKDVVFNSPKLVRALGVSYNGISVSWKSVPEAEGYYIYRKSGTSNWKKRGTVQGRDVTTWTDTKVAFGTKYTYTVRAWRLYNNKPVRSINYSETGVSAVCKLAAPKLTGATAGGVNAIKVTWNSVTGAQGYRVYRKVGDGKWKKLVDTSATSYTDKKVEKNTTYTYTVRAYRKLSGKKKLGSYDEKGVSAKAEITKQKKNGLVLYYDSNGKLITDVSSIIGKQSSYLLEVDYNNNVVTVYAKNGGSSYNTPVKAFVCSTGKATPIGTFHTPAKYRWHELNGNVYGQWCTRIHSGVLFHSVYYYKYNNNMSLAVGQYNKLGTKCSHGCVRLSAGDAKWVYDNCKLGTTVRVKKGCKNPFGKPTAYKLAKAHTWDPTDPNAYYKCRERGCH